MKQKRLAKTAPVPCVVRDPATDILGEDDSLAENIQRAPLHPLDQFRAFLALREKGRTEEDIAAAFFVGLRHCDEITKCDNLGGHLMARSGFVAREDAWVFGRQSTLCKLFRSVRHCR